MLGTLLLAVGGVFLFACLLFPALTGAVGSFLHDLSLGLCGCAAYLVPVLLVISAVFYKKDLEYHALPYKLLFGTLLTGLVGVLFHAAVWNDPVFDAEGAWNILLALFDAGTENIGGGVFGGLLAALLRLTGTVGTLIIAIPATALLALFFVGMTPKSLYITALYWFYQLRERREESRAQAEPDLEARRAALAAREEALAKMRAEQEQRRRAEQELRQRERSVTREEAALRGGRTVRRAGAIDRNIYASETDAVTAPAAASAAEDAYVMPEEPPVRKPSRAAAPRRDGAPVPETAYDRGQVEGDAACSTAVPPVQEPPAMEEAAAAEPARPDETAYALAAQDEEAALAKGQENQDTAAQDSGETERTEVLHPEPANEPVPTAEIDLAAIFANPGDEALTARYESTGYEEQTAEMDLSVTRTAPDGCEDTEDEDDGLPPFDMDPPSAAAEGIPAEIPLGDPDTDALLASLSSMYGAPAQTPETPEEPKYIFPPVTLLKKDTSAQSEDVADELETNAAKLVDILRSFNVKTKIVNVSRGPTITRYELQPEAGTRVRSVANLVDDIALGLAADGVRIEAPIPGKSAIGIEVPNRSVSTVYIRDLIESEAFRSAKSRLTTCLGMDVAGAPIFLDAAKMPHLLICGATGMGKSVCINALIVSMLYKATPDEVKLILIDPKKVELNIYSGIPHLLVPVVSDPKKAAGALHWAVTEMERRFELIEDVGMRDIKGYNEITKNDPDREYLPQIVIIIDELADLMMTAPDDVEESICRLAQKARAAGMHLIIGTQRPSVDVITGLIKANIPSRIAFRVSSQMDSRVVLDAVGAEKLIGRGDMLYAPVGAPKPQRVQGSFVSEEEIDAIISFIKKNAGHAAYSDDVMESIEKEAAMCGQKKGRAPAEGDDFDGDGTPDDPMLKNAVELAVESGKISTSLIQRRLSLGYGRAAKLIDRMEQLGYVSAPDGQMPRDVLITKEQFMEMVLKDTDS